MTTSVTLANITQAERMTEVAAVISVNTIVIGKVRERRCQMELKFEVDEQEIVDKVLEIVKDEFIPKSVIEEIIAEIMQYMFLNGFGSEYQDDMRKIIEKHISRKEN